MDDAFYIATVNAFDQVRRRKVDESMDNSVLEVEAEERRLKQMYKQLNRNDKARSTAERKVLSTEADLRRQFTRGGCYC